MWFKQLAVLFCQMLFFDLLLSHDSKLCIPEPPLCELDALLLFCSALLAVAHIGVQIMRLPAGYETRWHLAVRANIDVRLLHSSAEKNTKCKDSLGQQTRIIFAPHARFVRHTAAIHTPNFLIVAAIRLTATRASNGKDGSHFLFLEIQDVLI
jgi:hypothetical protein